MWYEYENEWIKLDSVETLKVEEIILFNGDRALEVTLYFPIHQKYLRLVGDNRQAEFEKIKSLLGIRDHTSRCC